MIVVAEMMFANFPESSQGKCLPICMSAKFPCMKLDKSLVPWGSLSAGLLEEKNSVE